MAATESLASAKLRGAFDLAGRTAVVTGAGRGIGRATAMLLAEFGAEVVCIDIRADDVTDTAAAITSAGGWAESIPGDVSQPADLDRAIVAAWSRRNRLDIMCNVAGILHIASVLDTKPDDLDRVFAVNVMGVFNGCRLAARRMVESGAGAIVNIASQAIDWPRPDLSAYAMSKAAVVQLTRSLAVEVAQQGVRVNAVAPGYVETAMTAHTYSRTDGSIDPEKRIEQLQAQAAANPLGRVGTPQDVAYAVLYLASDASGYVTGQIVRPNGGASMPW